MLALALVAFVAFVLMVGWNRGPEEETTTPAASSTTATTATTAAPSTDSSTTTVPMPALVPASAEDVAQSGFSPLLALSSTEVWAVVSTHEDFACVVGHLQEGEWTYWALDDGSRIRDLAGSPDGTIWLAGDAGVFSFDGRGWTRRLDGPAGGVAVSEEGLVWVGGSLAGDPPSPWLAGWDGEGWARLDSSTESGAAGLTPLALVPGGEVWITVYPGHTAGDLMCYDGAALGSVQVADLPDPEGVEGAVGVLAIEATPNGDLWIGGYLSSDWGEVVIARFGGDTWSLHDWPTDHTAIPQLIFDLAAGPDGVLWVGGQTGLASFDGTDWTLHIQGTWVGSLDVAPDGTVWYSDDAGLHTLRPP